MYKLVFYKDKKGKSDVQEYIGKLYKNKGKDSRIKFNKIQDYFWALEKGGLTLGEPYIKHLDGDIWEIRPLRDRILFAGWNGKYFVILSHFLKQTQKTPRKEIEKAITRFKDFLERIDEHEQQN